METWTVENRGQKTGDRRNVFWFSPKKSENVPSVPGFSVQAIDGAGGGRAVQRQREVAAFPGGQRLGRQRGGLLGGERAAVQRVGALPAFAGQLQRTAVQADLDRAGLREDSGLGEEVGVGVLRVVWGERVAS